MREILFRGKRIDNGDWIEGYYVKTVDYRTDSAVHSIIELPSAFYPRGEIAREYEISSSTIGQYTGLTDKHGKKIFEGDCFKTYCTGLPVYKHIVGYYPEHFAFMARCIEMNTVHYLSDYRPSAIEVIGNIHDNPELLEVTK